MLTVGNFSSDLCTDFSSKLHFHASVSAGRSGGANQEVEEVGCTESLEKC